GVLVLRHLLLAVLRPLEPGAVGIHESVEGNASGDDGHQPGLALALLAPSARSGPVFDNAGGTAFHSIRLRRFARLSSCTSLGLARGVSLSDLCAFLGLPKTWLWAQQTAYRGRSSGRIPFPGKLFRFLVCLHFRLVFFRGHPIANPVRNLLPI